MGPSNPTSCQPSGTSRACEMIEYCSSEFVTTRNRSGRSCDIFSSLRLLTRNGCSRTRFGFPVCCISGTLGHLLEQHEVPRPDTAVEKHDLLTGLELPLLI